MAQPRTSGVRGRQPTLLLAALGSTNGEPIRSAGQHDLGHVVQVPEVGRRVKDRIAATCGLRRVNGAIPGGTTDAR